MIVGNIIGGGPSTPKSVMFRTEDGEEMYAVLVGSEQVFTATPNDIREGKTAGTDAGVVTGTKVIPAYHTREGFQVIPVGSKYAISLLKDLDAYDFTKLQAIICEFNTSMTDSVSANKISIYEKVYEVMSTAPLSTISKDSENKTVDFGLTNDSEVPHIIRFFTYKEVP